jgi:flagellum-specific peptidoglycan hydrolase FlgJ
MQPTGNYPVHYQGHSHQSNLLSYNPQQQQQQQQQHLLAAKPKPKPVTTPKPYKVGLPAAFSLSLQSTKSTIQVPSKQSPVPLPANFLASMTSGPPTPASSKLSQHTQAEDNHVTEAVEQTATSTVATQALPVPAPQSAIPAAKPSTVPGKVSTTPVPLPRLPGMTPYQAAAQAHGAHPEETRPRSNPSDGPPSMNAQMGTSSLPPMNINPMGYQHNSESVTRIEESGPNRPLAASTTPTAPFPPSNIPAPSASTNDANIKVHGRESLADQTMLSTSNEPQEFPDVPGCESMEFVERMMQNLRRASQRTDSA